MSDIDIVVLWVDDSNEEWRKERDYWKNLESHGKTSDTAARFRDWGLFKYWFRSIEKNAPWVRKVHLVTNGIIPAWINPDCEKLQLDYHKDFMPADCLPTFSSCAIELCLHKIQGLAEQFVYFNDDVFLLKEVPSDFFFKDGLRADLICERNLLKFSGTEFGQTLRNMVDEINSQIPNKREIIKNSIGKDKWFSKDLPFTYRLSNALNYAISKHFVGFSAEHTAAAFTKSLIQETWEQHNDALSRTVRQRFRTTEGVNQYIFRYHSVVNGSYFVNKAMRGEYHTLNEEEKVIHSISKPEYPVVCLNDTSGVTYTEDKARRIRDAFKRQYPEKSSFEK